MAFSALLVFAALLSDEATLDWSLKRQGIGAAVDAVAEKASISLSRPPFSYHDGQVGPFDTSLNAEEMMRLILQGSGYQLVRLKADVYLITRRPPGGGQDSGADFDASNYGVQELVVSATKREEILINLPYSISSYGGSDLLASGLDQTTDVARATPSLFYTNQGPGLGKLVLRGLADGAFNGRAQSLVGVYLNDARLTYNAPDPALPLFDVERIEVLRGPQGTLYGSGSMGGLLRVVTRQPDLEKIEAVARASYTLQSDGDSGFDAQAGLNIPLVENKIALRSSVSYGELGGYIDVPTLELQNTNKVETVSARSDLLWQISQNWSLNIGGQYLDRKALDSNYTDTEIGPLAKATQTLEPRAEEFWATSAVIKGTIGSLTLTSTTSYIARDIETEFDATIAIRELGGNPDEIAISNRFQNIRAFENETHLSSQEGGRLEWTLGSFFSTRDEDVDVQIRLPRVERDLGLDAPGVFYSERFRDDLEELAFFGEVTFYLNQWLSFTGGLRWFETETVAGSFIDDIGRGNFFEGEGSRRENDITPKFVMSFHPTERHLLYFQLAEGYRLGGVNLKGPTFLEEDEEIDEIDELEDDDVQFFDLATFASDRLLQFELGYKGEFWDGRIGLQASIFHADWDDLQSDQFDDNGLPIAGNVGDATVHGFEIEALFKPSPNFEFRGYLSHTNPRLNLLDSFGEDIGADLQDQLPGAADWTAGVSLYGSKAVGENLVSAIVRYNYIASAPLLFDTEDRFASDTVNQLDASLTFERGATVFFVEAQNITNSRANQFSFGNPFSLQAGSQAVPLRPFSITFGAQISF